MEIVEMTTTSTDTTAAENLPKITYFDKLYGIRDGKNVYFIVDGIYHNQDGPTTVELLDLDLRKIIPRKYDELQMLIKSGVMKYWSPDRSRFIEGVINSK